MIRVLAFGRIRELLGFGEREFGVVDAATVGGLRQRLEGDAPELATLRDSTRVARNGALVGDDERLRDGDEVAFLPPVGGG
ncbi:MAG: MoaD/ThiS family protein [Candidatus Eremiobacteraeota bacterium]|nr:MoaD/ThiS family protein [Candidatus Eremiobacteraeota bacterium]